MPISKTNKWVHPLCSTWIPELFQVPSTVVGKPPSINLVNLDKKRYNLKCVLCSKKGACIQCCAKRCTVPVHPWCVLQKNTTIPPHGFTKRIVTAPDTGEVLWEIFCKNHAECVSEPVKPRNKNKIISSSMMMNTTTTIDATNTTTTSLKKIDEIIPKRDSKLSFKYLENDSYSTVSLSMNHMKNFLASRLLTIDDRQEEKENDILIPIVNATKSSTTNNNTTNNTNITNNTTNYITTSSTSSKAQFPILSMSEWPGQSEGEGMDMEHFWNVIKGYYPEEHSKQWLDFMLNDLLKSISTSITSGKYIE